MATKKEPIEIECSECEARFRLWVPEEMLSEWEHGSKISCIKCGALHFLKKGKNGYAVTLIREEPAVKKAAVEERAVEKRPVERKPAPAPVPAAAPAHHHEPQPAHSKEVVLVIEDDRLSREMVENTLRDIGFRLISARNGVEALKVLRKENVRLIVTDLYLKNPADPESVIDGEELLKRAVESGYKIPAIITTGKDIIDDLVLDPKWFDLHVKGFIQKGNPFWAEELKVKIKEVMYKD